MIAPLFDSVIGVDYAVGSASDAHDAEYVLTLDREADAALVETLWKRRSEADLWMVSRVPTRGISNHLYRRLLDLPYYDYGSPTRLYHQSALARGGATLDKPHEALLRLHSAGFARRSRRTKYC